MDGLRSWRMTPEVHSTKSGDSKVRIRQATMDDYSNLNDVLDLDGVGAGVPGDPILKRLFKSFVNDIEMIALWAEDAEPPHTTLGFICVTLPTCYESHIHSLRVAKA